MRCSRTKVDRLLWFGHLVIKYVGLIFDESAPRDPTLEVTPPKAKVSLKEDPRQSEVIN